MRSLVVSRVTLATHLFKRLFTDCHMALLMTSLVSAFDDATNRLRQELDESKPKPSVSGKGFYGYEPGRETEAIDGHNQKVEQYNRVLYDLRSKTKRCDQMIAQYNDQLVRYKACSSR